MVGEKLWGMVVRSDTMIIVQPETVIRWHREGFRLYWRWRSRGPRGRPIVSEEIRNLIRPMSQANPLWGAPRIHGELSKLGIEISQAAVSKYMVRGRKPPSQTWRRQILQFNVTPTPSAVWTGQQIVEAFPWDAAPRFLLRDRHAIYGTEFVRRVDPMGVEQVPTSPRSPWQNQFVDRLIGSIRWECVDHTIIFSERHLRRVLRSYCAYYHGS